MSKKAWLFLKLTFLLSWALAASFKLLGGLWNTRTAFFVALLYMFMPAISVFIVQKLVYKEKIKEPLAVSFKFNRWFFIAWFLPLGISLLTIGVSLLLPGIKYNPDMSVFLDRMKDAVSPEQFENMASQLAAFPISIFWIVIIQGLIAGITVNAVFGFGEELGWRGLLQKELISRGFWKSSLLIGFIWGLWHAPLVIQGHNYPVHPFAGVFMMIVWCMLLSPILSYVRLKSKSVVASAIMHGSINGIAGLAIIFISGGSDLTTGITGLPGFIALIVVNLFILMYGNPSVLKEA